jgi:hypothetical protein
MCSENYLGNIFLLFFLYFFRFFCVKRLDSVSGCPDSAIVSSGRACQGDLLRGTTFERHLSFVRTVNPIGLYRIPPRRSPSHFIFFLGLFVVLCVFHVLFMCASHVRLSVLQFISTPGTLVSPFTDLF